MEEEIYLKAKKADKEKGVNTHTNVFSKKSNDEQIFNV